MFETANFTVEMDACGGYLFTILGARFRVTTFLIDTSFFNSIKGFRRSFLAFWQILFLRDKPSNAKGSSYVELLKHTNQRQNEERKNRYRYSFLLQICDNDVPEIAILNYGSAVGWHRRSLWR